jgi:hypothetical protein
MVAALLILLVEGILLIRHYDYYYGSDAGSGPTASKVPETAAPEQTPRDAAQDRAAEREQAAVEQKEVTSQQDEAADQRVVTSQRDEREYVGAVGDIQTRAVETFLKSHNKILQYDALTADDVEQMKANETALQDMADQTFSLTPTRKYEEQHEVFSAAIDQLHKAARLAYSMAADPVAAAELGFNEYDGHVSEASALLQRSNELLGKDYETIEGVQEISPEF